MDKDLQELIGQLEMRHNAEVITKRNPYSPGIDVQLTNVFAKENRHPKMPENYVAIIVPIEKD